MYRFQDSQLEKQEARAVAMRQRFQDRTQRFLNAKQRTIGIDKQFLDQQVNEKNALYEEERNKSISEGKSNGTTQKLFGGKSIKSPIL